MHNFFNPDGTPVEIQSFSELTAAPLIINIGRQLGSGGREIGKELARRFGMDYYDKELLTEKSRSLFFFPLVKFFFLGVNTSLFVSFA